MSDWLNALAALQQPAILVTVAQVEGSAPRASGASMVITANDQFDTLGGGHLELQAVATARDMLARSPLLLGGCRQLVRFSLGPTLGQCCGGVVQLVFERIDAGDRALAATLASRRDTRCDTWRLTPLDTVAAQSLCTQDRTVLHGPATPASLKFDASRPCHLQRDAAGRRWLIAPCLADRPQLVLFGAGHVGAALVRALAVLPCHVTWVDSRDDIFPAVLPDNVTRVLTDLPETAVDDAPTGASFLVMTHSHTLDQQLAECILRRADVGWFGLIGSKTKRMLFEHRLHRRGIAAERLAAMTCPIGLPGIRGKEPVVIAASVAAQLLAVWEAQPTLAAPANDLPSLSIDTATATADSPVHFNL